MTKSDQGPEPSSANSNSLRSLIAPQSTQTAILVLVALAAAWTFAITSAMSSEPAAGTPAPTAAPQTSTSTTAEPVEEEPVELAVPVVKIAAPVAVSTTTAAPRFSVGTDRSIAFDALLTDRHVHVVGDSLTLSAQNELRAIFGEAIDVRAESGLGLYYADSWIAAAAVDPDIVVVSLGTNDWNAPEAFIESARRTLDTLAGAACVVWVDTQPFKPELAMMNAGLRELTAEYGVYVAGWSAVSEVSELHGSDGYHLSAAGQQLFADLIATTVESACL